MLGTIEGILERFRRKIKWVRYSIGGKELWRGRQRCLIRTFAK